MSRLKHSYTITLRSTTCYNEGTYTDMESYDLDYEHDFLIIRKGNSIIRIRLSTILELLITHYIDVVEEEE